MSRGDPNAICCLISCKFCVGMTCHLCLLMCASFGGDTLEDEKGALANGTKMELNLTFKKRGQINM